MPTERIPVGYVRRAHGIAGAVIVRPLTDDPGRRFRVDGVFATDDPDVSSLEIEAASPYRGDYLVSFRSIKDREVAEGLTGLTLTIGRDERRSLGRDEYWPEDLVGCSVSTRDGAQLGTVIGVQFGDAQDRLTIEDAEGRIGHLPFVSDLVPEVSVESRAIVVDPPGGLFE